MSSLVAYDDSDSDAELELTDQGGATGPRKDSSTVAQTLDFATHALCESAGGVLPPKPGSCEEVVGPRLHLPLARLGRVNPGSCPSQRLQWPLSKLEVICPNPQPQSSLWMNHLPEGHVPVAVAHGKPLKHPWERYGSLEPPRPAQTKAEAPGNSICSHQRKRGEDCVVPYIPKRLRQLPESNSDNSKSRDGDSSVGPGRPLASLSVRPRVSKLIEPYLDSQYKETVIAKKVLFQLRGHRGPVNSIQWCPVLSHSHMLLSTSMDKTFKVWDAVDAGNCLQTYSLHGEAVRAARWSHCGQRILSGGFDFALRLTDLETGAQLLTGQSDFRVTAVKFHPKEHDVFLCGGFSPEIKAWDIRTGKVVRGYKATVQQTLDILFLQEGSEFLSSTDASSRDSADRTIIAWDFRSSAKISNQIFHERYTCPSLALHPREPVFLAQTNGNYLALFSAVWPYRMSRRRRYEGHKVEGYAVGCECSPDGELLATGSADGRVLLYTFRTASQARMLHAHTQACLGVTFHPVLPSIFATSSWEGEVKIWH